MIPANRYSLTSIAAAILAAIVVCVAVSVATAQDAPPPCVGDQCPAVATSHVAKSTTTGPIRSIVVQRAYLLPRVREAQPARKLAGVAVRGTSKVLRGCARVAKAALPPYPRVRQRMAARFGR